AALGEDIATLPWMTPATRAAAAAKLHAVANKIGYPDHWRDYRSVRVDRRDALGNAARAREFDLARRLGKIGRPLDRGEWTPTPRSSRSGRAALPTSTRATPRSTTSRSTAA